MKEIMPYVATVVMSLVSGILLYICKGLIDENKKIKKLQTEEEQKIRTAVIQAVVQLLRIQLCEYHDKYMEVGEIPTYVYDNWTRMYQQYKSLGGNGMVTHMNEDIESLHMKNK